MTKHRKLIWVAAAVALAIGSAAYGQTLHEASGRSPATCVSIKTTSRPSMVRAIASLAVPEPTPIA
jgi:hypothetical protein